MHRRSFALVVIVGLLLIGVIGMAFPGSAGAAIVSGQWAETVYTGTDSYYSTSVVAYEAGSRAKLTVKVYNDQSVDVTIKEAKIKFDWGQEYTATTSPAEIRVGEYALFGFEFDVPQTDVASNKVLHSYTILVGYQVQGTSYVRNWVANQHIGTGNAAQTVFSFPGGDWPLVADSVTLSFVDASANTITPVASSAYSINVWNHQVTFNTAPANGILIYASYKHCDYLGTGNDYNTVFSVSPRPVIPGSLRVFVVNGVTETVTEIGSGAYTFVPETGKLTMAAAPTGFEYVYGTWEYFTRWSALSGSDFAVYSADQADARELRSTYDEMYRPYIFLPSSEGSKLKQEADLLADLGQTAYKNGNFTAAKDYFQQAVDTFKAAVDADTTVNSSIEDFLTGIGAGAAEWIDSQAAKGDAEAAKLNAEAERIKAMTDAEVDKVEAEAGFSKLYGIFLVLIGVTGLLGGIGGILWAGSRLVAARRM